MGRESKLVAFNKRLACASYHRIGVIELITGIVLVTSGAPISSLNAQNQSAVPNPLLGKTIEYKFEANVVVTKGGVAVNSTKTTMLLRARLSSRDVYLFSARPDFSIQEDQGFVYKLNSEVDFLREPSRVPPGPSSLAGYSLYKGITKIDNRTFNIGSTVVVDTGSLSTGRPNGINMTNSQNTRIDFSLDFRTCKVTGYTAKATSTDIISNMSLARPIACSVR